MVEGNIAERNIDGSDGTKVGFHIPESAVEAGGSYGSYFAGIDMAELRALGGVAKTPAKPVERKQKKIPKTTPERAVRYIRRQVEQIQERGPNNPKRGR